MQYLGCCVFRKGAAALIFVRLLLRAPFFQVYMIWIAFAGFITFEVNLCYYYICGFNTARLTKLAAPRTNFC